MARSLNGTTDQISCGTSATLQTGIMSLSIWFKYSSLSTSRNLIGWSDASNGVHIILNSTGKLAYYCTDSASNNVFVDPATNTATANVWHNVVLTYTAAAGLKAFLDNVSDATNVGQGNPLKTGLGDTFGIGYDPGAAGKNFPGSLAVAAMWNVALTAGEISALSNGALPINIRPANLGGYWPLDGLQSPEPDYSGNKNNGTLTGTTLASGPPVMMLSPRLPLIIKPPPPPPPPAGPLVVTTLTNVPAKTFTRKHYKDELTKIREEAIAVAALLADLDDKQRADLAYENARNQYDQDEAALFGRLTQEGHNKLTESKERLEELRKARDHQYFMEIVNKEWAKHKNKKN